MSAHIPRKRFGQNFLHERHIIDQIVCSIDPQPTDHLVEIGPGQAALTAPLLARVDRLEAVEIDKDLSSELCARYPALTLYQADALKFDFGQCFQRQGQLRIIGNLPYNISTPLLFHLLSFSDQVIDMHVMLQYEVARRLAAQPGGSEYGRLSVMVQYAAQVERLIDVAPGAFRPPPKVRSSVVRIKIQTPRLRAEQPQHFAKLVERAFSQRRKTLINALGQPVQPEVLESLGLARDVRAQHCSVQDFIRLSNRLSTWPLKDQ